MSRAESALATLILLGALSAQGEASKAVPPAPAPPSDAECHALPPLRSPWSFAPGEVLEFDLDALGAKAGTMSLTVLPSEHGALPISVNVQTNTFFSKVRRVRATATSYLTPSTLRPARYVEDSMENDIHRTAEVAFSPKERKARMHAVVNGTPVNRDFVYPRDAFDDAGVFAVLRQLPYRKGLAVCLDAFGLRRMWRVSGTVVGREHISLAVGEFEAWHLQGEAVRLDDFHQRREVHLWISDDARRLPLVAVGAIDLGAVRATLKAFSRPHEKHVREDKSTMSW